ncbi:hypothetical protein [uncultured Trichococcus sp.]|nr:hypothetical protein [uncultured Trichococcus sp.]
MSIFWQAVIAAIFVTIAFIDSHTAQTHIFRPNCGWTYSWFNYG